RDCHPPDCSTWNKKPGDRSLSHGLTGEIAIGKITASASVYDGLQSNLMNLPVKPFVKPLRSGGLARLAAVSPDTLRYYERQHLLPRPPRASNGYRCYPPDALPRVRLIQRAL